MVGAEEHNHSTAKLQNVAHQLFRAALSPSTTSSYERMISRYSKFCTGFFSNRPVFPSTHDMLSQFIASLYLDNLSPSTIASYISAISFAHKCKEYHDPTTSFLIKKILKGVQNVKGTTDSRLPITGPILAKLLAAVPLVITGEYHQHLLKSMFLLAFHAFLRIGEITTRGPSDHNRVLQVPDVTFQYSDNSFNGMSLTISHYKHSDLHPKVIQIPTNRDLLVCPVAVLSAYLTLSGHRQGPLFQFPCGTPVSQTYFSAALKSILLFIDLDPKFYKGHSFRIGAATAAAARGVPMSVIQSMGRWKSDAVKNYIRMHSFQI